MITAIIIAIISMVLYLGCTIYYMFFRPHFIINLMLNYPIRTMIITKLWWYGSMITLIGCVVFHFIQKYW